MTLKFEAICVITLITVILLFPPPPPSDENKSLVFFTGIAVHVQSLPFRYMYRRSMAEILPIRRKTLSNQSIYQSDTCILVQT